MPLPDPEATGPTRRTFTRDEKLQYLQQADACQPGELSAFLRKNGLYTSHLTDWRRILATEGSEGLHNKKSGPKTQTPTQKDLERLEAENRRLQEKLRQAELIIDIQKKIAALFPDPKNNEKT